MLRFAFINENTLGHGSYLNPLVRHFESHPQLGIEPHIIDAVPLPKHLKWYGEFSIRGLRRFGLDFHMSRCRFAASRHVRERVEELRHVHGLAGLVVNTQSAGLDLHDIGLPIHVCLDATFRQLARSPWFAPNLLSRWVQPLTLRGLFAAERRLFKDAASFLPWSEGVRQSLIEEYGVPAEKIMLLPPSVTLKPRSASWPSQVRPRILFMGGDFRRKGGELLLDCYHKHLTCDYDLHVVTQSALAEMPGVFVHRNVQAQSPQWLEQWQKADVFVFPSTLETFGIVLLEALAFGVPVVSSTAGAAQEVLADGQAGLLVSNLNTETLAQAIQTVFLDKETTKRRVAAGLRRADTDYQLSRNAERLASWLQARLKQAEPAPLAEGPKATDVIICEF
jgi:glycosyltransferase involved in cell wall biosynthesis